METNALLENSLQKTWIILLMKKMRVKNTQCSVNYIWFYRYFKSFIYKPTEECNNETSLSNTKYDQVIVTQNSVYHIIYFVCGM